MACLNLLLWLAATVTVVSVADLPCGCTLGGDPPTTTDTPDQRSTACGHAQSQLTCYKSCDNATEAEVNELTQLLETFQCNGGDITTPSHILLAAFVVMFY